MTTETMTALKQIADAVLAAVQESGPRGIDGGTLYAAMMTAGISLEQFNEIMAALVSLEIVRKTGDCYVGYSFNKR